MFSRQSTMMEKLIANPTTSLRILERHLSKFDNLWASLQEKHDMYVIECVTDDVEKAANVSLIERYHLEYIRIEAACDNRIPTTELKPVSSAPSTNSIKLERVKFRTFDGDVRKYPKFKAEFDKYVTPLCSDSQLPFVLKSYLSDSVRREVENLDHDLTAMWKRLDEKYGCIQKQIDSIMYEFKHLPACKDTQSTLRMIHLVETADSDLKCMNASEELENHVIISHIERSMSKMMLEDWAKMIVRGEKSESSQTKFQNLPEFLLYWRELLEYNDAEIRSESRKKATVDTGDVFHGEISVVPDSDCTSIQQRPKSKCLVHTDASHPVWRCRFFRDMTVEERERIVESSKACKLCLVKGHSSHDCNVLFRCTVQGCRSAHHNVLLHPHYT